MSCSKFSFPVLAFAAACLVCMSSLGGCEKPAAGDAPNVLHFTVGGLHCDGCAGTVRSEVSKMGGVRSCRVSFEEGTAVVEVDDPSMAQAIIERIESLDFTAALQPPDEGAAEDSVDSVDSDEPAERE